MLKLITFVVAGTALLGADWASVQRLSPGQKLEVQALTIQTTRGTFVRATETTLVFQSKSGEQSIARGDIRRVRVADASRRVRSGLIGAAIGVGAGLGLGVAVCPHCGNEGSAGKYVGPLTAVGGALGTVAGFLPTRYRTIHQIK